MHNDVGVVHRPKGAMRRMQQHRCAASDAFDTPSTAAPTISVRHTTLLCASAAAQKQTCVHRLAAREPPTDAAVRCCDCDRVNCGCWHVGHRRRVEQPHRRRPQCDDSDDDDDDDDDGGDVMSTGCAAAAGRNSSCCGCCGPPTLAETHPSGRTGCATAGGGGLGLMAMLAVLVAVMVGDATAAHLNAAATAMLSNELLPFLVDDAAAAAHHRHPSPGFASHTRIYPTLQHARHKHLLQNTKQQDGSHADDITVRFRYAGGEMIADLHANVDLMPAGHFLRYQTPDGGDAVRSDFNRIDAELCHYRGHIRDNPESRVAMSTCSGLRGILFDGRQTFYIAAASDGNVSHVDHYLYSHADLIPKAHACDQHNHHDDDGRNQSSMPVPMVVERNATTHGRRRRSAAASDDVIHGPYNSNRDSSYVELMLVADHSVFEVHKTVNKVHEYCKSLANIVNALYMPLNIFVALTGVEVWNESNKIEIVYEGELTLRAFAEYRRRELLPHFPNDNAHLLTRKKFKDDVVGKAYKGEMCTYQTSVGIAQDHSPIVGVVATTIAHEMGHNFGMEHDDEKCKCAVNRCIMAAATSSEVTLHWSSCSIDQLNRAFHRGANYCLKNKPARLFEPSTCGNGFVEHGEQCDCGEPGFCSNPCCDPATCMLRSNASCATGSCCDLDTCRPRAAGFECRSAERSECDLAEFCTGESEYCPADFYRRDTEPCAGGTAFCYRGACRSHDDQCRTLWGPSGTSSPECYAKNTEGNKNGNCGYDQSKTKFAKCSVPDVACGRLQCRHLNERLEFGEESRAILTYSYMTSKDKYSLIPCRTVTLDFGLQNVDPGLTPNGARCGADAMCLNQTCRPLQSLWDEGVGRQCAANCSGHGSCDNTGSCFCEVGFGGEKCDEPGPGGSRNSGPATNPNDGSGFVRVMYVFFLGVVPFVSLFLFFVYYWRQNRPSFLRKSANVFKSHTIKSSPHRGGGGGSGAGGHSNLNGGQHIAPPSLTSPTSTIGVLSTPSSTDDMNCALLRGPHTSGSATSPLTPDASATLNNNMFGQFKGFSLKPLPQHSRPSPKPGATNIAYVQPVAKADVGAVPQRSAPPVPHAALDAKSVPETTAAPALPPFNPGSTARPLISSPILEASTCSAKELISPLRHHNDKYPVRSAPAPPVPPHGIGFNSQARPDPVPSTPSTKEKPKVKESAMRRIASFLIKEDRNAAAAGAAAVKNKPTLDKDQLRNIKISAPLSTVDLVADVAAAATVPAADESGQRTSTSSITRTQSMREPSTGATTAASVLKRANLPTFGSMRHPPGVRPGSVAGLTTRPKSPPPPRPPVIVALPEASKPLAVAAATKKPAQHQYDETPSTLGRIREDASPTHSDNIYAVIDEYQVPSGKRVAVAPIAAAAAAVPKAAAPSTAASLGTGGGMGLLGEIVNEIENRNLNSIYSASTLSRKKSKEDSVKPVPVASKQPTPVTTPSAEYSNVKPSVSRPAPSTAPVARVAPVNKVTTPAVPTFSSFRQKSMDKTDTTSAPASTKSQNAPNALTSGPQAAVSLGASTTKPSSTAAGASANTSTPFSRTKTPPSLSATVRTRSPSPSRPKPPVSSAKPVTLLKPAPAKPTTTSTNSSKPLASVSKPTADAFKPKPTTVTKPTSGFASAATKTSKFPSATTSGSNKWSSGSSSTPTSSTSSFGSKTSSTAADSKTAFGKPSSGAISSLQQKFELAGGNNKAMPKNSATAPQK